MARIYISSTFEDLRDYRVAVDAGLRKLQHKVICMEDYVASDSRPLDRCLRDVAGCDVYVGILAWRYGYIPQAGNPDHRSITELEYRHAVSLNKPCLLFLHDPRQPWPPIFREDGAPAGQLEQFRAEVERDRVVSSFGSTDDLVNKVNTAVTVLLDEMRTQPEEPTPRSARASAAPAESPQPRELTYHALLLYADADEDFALRLSDGLRQRQYSSKLAKRVLFANGELDLLALERAVRQCHTVILVLSDVCTGMLDSRPARTAQVLALLHARTGHVIGVCRTAASRRWADKIALDALYDVSTVAASADELNLVRQLETYLQGATPLPGRRAVGLPLMIVAMTAAEAELFAPRSSSVEPFATFSAAMQQYSPIELANRYGTVRADWKPFAGSPSTIVQLVESVITYMNAQEGPRLRGLWLKVQHYAFDMRTPETRELRHIYMELAQTGCVVVIDDLSLFHPGVREAFRDSPLFNSQQAALVSISPFNADTLPPARMLETELWRRLAVAFDRFDMDYDPQCEFGIGDERRLRRWLHNSLPQAAQNFREPQPDPRLLNEFVGSMGLARGRRVAGVMYT